MIVGYGTSHDAGVAAVDESGIPFFAASAERLGRSKNQSYGALSVWHWLARYSGGRVGRFQIAPIEDDSCFKLEKGFFPLEKNCGAVYRWTGEEATYLHSEPIKANRVLIRFVGEEGCSHAFAADIYADGERIGLAHNSRSNNLLKIKSGNVREIKIRPRHVKEFPPDPRRLGVMLQMLAFETLEDQEWSHVVSSATNRVKWRRLLFEVPKARKRMGYSVFPRYFLQFVEGISNLHGSTSACLLRAPTRITGHYDHHMCHAATAYFPSGFGDALVITVDAFGDFFSATVSKGTDGVLETIRQYCDDEFTAGADYCIVTALLGYLTGRHEGKITGLAAFGKENKACEDALAEFLSEVHGGKISKGGWYDLIWEDWSLVRSFREKRFSNFSREDMAYAIQKRCEETVVALVREWKERFPELKNIALAGGVFANVKLNQRIKELGFENIFIQPAMSDAGLCYGAALLEAAKQNGGKLTPYRLRDVFLGVGYTNEEIKAEIDKHGLEAELVDEDRICEVIADYIYNHRVVAHFDGRMEFGPRALGNRSILCNADDPEINDWLNKRLQRTEFMPFAPAVMWEHADEYFLELEGARHTAEFMTITCDVTEKAQAEIPAAVHIDGTARPQLVHAERNPRFYAILKAFHERSGVACLINTSFNMHEEPIVATPYDAIRAFQLGHLDVLVLGNWIVENPELNEQH